MELFTIGLCRLNSDGTQVRDPSTGQCMQTYDNDAIMTFARAWTGFYPPAARGNIEAVTGDGAVNRVASRARCELRMHVGKLLTA